MIPANLFLAECGINTASGLIFLFVPDYHLKLILGPAQYDSIHLLLGRWWGCMLLMQAGLLGYGYQDPKITRAIYWSLLIGELVLIPVMLLHRPLATSFIWSLVLFGLVRVYYLFPGLGYQIVGDIPNLLTRGVDFIVNDLSLRASTSSDRFASARLGPNLSNTPSLIVAHGDQETVKFIASSQFPGLRKTFDPIKKMCGLDNSTQLSAKFVFDSVNAVHGRSQLKRFLSGKYLELIYQESLVEFRARFAKATDVSIAHLVNHSIFNIIGRVILGLTDLPADTVERMESIQMCTIKGSAPMTLGNWQVPITPAQFKFKRAMEDYSKLCREILHRNRSSILQGDNYIHALMAEMAALNGGAAEDYLEHPDIIHNIPTLFLGVGNPVGLLSFTPFILAQHPTITQKLRHEVISTDVTSQIRLSPYLEAVFKELLRYICPANLIIRYAATDINSLPFSVPKGSLLALCMRGILRDPQHWSEPDSFNPERFRDASVEESGFNYPNVVFSVGERICPAIQVTRAMFKAFIRVWQEYTFTPTTAFAMPRVDATTRLAPECRGTFSIRQK